MAMTLYSARDLPGAQPGASTILPMVVAVFAFINHLILEAVQKEVYYARKDKKENTSEKLEEGKMFETSPA